MGAVCVRSEGEPSTRKRPPAGLSPLADKEDGFHDGVGASVYRAQGSKRLIQELPGALFPHIRIRHGNIRKEYIMEDTVLGVGCSSYVRRAASRRTGKQFAVKPYDKRGRNKEKTLMLTNEIQVYLRLDHPHIARLIEVWEDATHVYVVMEYCAGGNLADRLRAWGTVPEDECRFLVLQMLSTLTYLHAHNVVHRDLRLDNWLCDTVGKSFALKLVSFCFSTMWFPNSKRMRPTCGTLAYVSPEVLLGAYTNTCDNWSLGVSVYILLAGYPPFFGTEEELFSKILASQYSLSGSRWDSISPEGKHFVRKLLEKDPDKRMTAQQAYDHPWLLGVYYPPLRSLDVTHLNSLCSFASLSILQRAVFMVIALSLCSDEIAEHIVHGFFSLDALRKGVIDIADLTSSLRYQIPYLTDNQRPSEAAQVLRLISTLFQNCTAYSVHFSLTPISRIFKALDTSRAKEIQFNAFVAAMLSGPLPIQEDWIRCAFSKLEPDATGHISLKNFKRLFTHAFSQKAIFRIVTDATKWDKDDDSRLHYRTFKAIATQRPPPPDSRTPVMVYTPVGDAPEIAESLGQLPTSDFQDTSNEELVESSLTEEAARERRNSTIGKMIPAPSG